MNWLLKICNFIKSAYSEPSGNGSSSRLLSTYLAIVCSVILWKIFNHLIAITDSTILGMWLVNLPLIISSLVLLFTAPYGVNKGSASVTDILNLFKGKKNE